MEKSRAELLKTIESQGEQLIRYENRLRDIVNAYKGLVTEKDALDASFSALSKKQTSSRIQDGVRSTRANGDSSSSAVPSAAGSEDEASVRGVDSCENVGDTVEDDVSDAESTADLSDKLATLSTSLATISSEKSRMAASFQADKKQLLQENESLQLRHREESQKMKSDIARMKEEADLLRKQLREQQQQHDQEQTNHAAMLRELQLLLAEERTAKDDLELKVENVEAMARRQVTNVRAENEQLTCKLNAEVKGLRADLAQRGKVNQDDTVILHQVQVQMAQMKLQHSENLSKERQRACDAEQRIAAVSQREEERVASLEAQLAELTVMVGRYDRLREQDQQAISHLQGQVSENNKQNMELREQLSEAQTDDSKKEAASLRERLIKLSLLLKEASPESLTSLDVGDEMLDSEERIDEQLHLPCQRRYKALCDEFESFKASTVMVQRSDKDGNSEELRRLHGQLRHLRDRLQPMQQQVETYQGSVQDRDRQVEQLQVRVEDEKLDHQKALSAALASHQQELLSVQAARERSYTLLQDREAEIERLRTQLASSAPDDWARSSAVFASSQRHRTSSSTTPASPQRTLSSSFPEMRDGAGSVDQAVEDLLVHSSQPFPSAGSNSLLHYAQQQQRVAAEVEQCRSQRDDLLSELRDFREKAERYEEQCGLLKEEIRRLDRSKDRSTASLEYLKNVVLSFMTLEDHSPGRIHIANAIATILQFSPDERHKAIQNTSKSSWWPPAPGK